VDPFPPLSAAAVDTGYPTAAESAATAATAAFAAPVAAASFA